MYMAGSPDKTVLNEWVCATPSEFTEKLKKLLESDYVKAKVVSLLAPMSSEAPPVPGAATLRNTIAARGGS